MVARSLHQHAEKNLGESHWKAKVGGGAEPLHSAKLFSTVPGWASVHSPSPLYGWGDCSFLGDLE